MKEAQKVVARFRDGRIVKGYLKDFRIDADTVLLNDAQTKEESKVRVEELKAIFFVKTFKGYNDRVERKAFGIRRNRGRKTYVKFSDKETLVGYIEGSLPWDRGFSLAKLGAKARGFMVTPVDDASNNSKVFVVGNAIKDITIMVI
jgi:hypothetical protein